mgnify:CR=1 FL=1|tara:strand:- start:769 stop:1347 length:579 start_codon:yes stop_codon:yes gene_type:complete
MKYDAIIVLGNEMSKSGVLNIESMTRMDKAIQCFNEGLSSIIVTCGWDYRKDSRIPIAEAMKSYAIKQGVLGSNVRVECASRDTVGDAFFTKINHSMPQNWQSLIVITSDYHVKRTNCIFKFIHGNKYKIKVIGAGDFENKFKRISELKSLQDFNRTFENIQEGNNEEIYSALKTKHPFYNGVIYPEIEVVL